MGLPGFGGRRAHVVDRLEKSTRVRGHVGIEQKAGAALHRAINVQTLGKVGMSGIKRALPAPSVVA